MAERMLTVRDQAALSKLFEEAELHGNGAEKHERYFALADALAEKFGVSQRIPAAAHLCGSGKCHTHGH